MRHDARIAIVGVCAMCVCFFVVLFVLCTAGRHPSKWIWQVYAKKSNCQLEFFVVVVVGLMSAREQANGALYAQLHM